MYVPQNGIKWEEYERRTKEAFKKAEAKRKAAEAAQASNRVDVEVQATAARGRRDKGKGKGKSVGEERKDGVVDMMEVDEAGGVDGRGVGPGRKRGGKGNVGGGGKRRK